MSDPTHSTDDTIDVGDESDPRVHEASLRRIESEQSPVILVGVVHDHPASVHRAAAVVEAVDPETVAVELPELLVTTVMDAAESESGDDAGVPEVGGEMAAAIAAAPGSVVGIDVPGPGTGRSVYAELRSESVRPRTLLRTLRGVGRMSAHAVFGRLAGLGVPGTPSLERIEKPREYELSADATPAEQAEHERAHLRRSTTLLRSLDPPPSTALLDGIRERQMAMRVRALSEEGAVVAVVGYGHLEPIEALLDHEWC